MRTLLIATIALAAAFGAEAQNIYRCASAGGVVYQELPCAAGASERSWKSDFPPANTAERDRLLQREAALDARMLKRAEMEAAERVAKEARWAREAELEAERERARAAEGLIYYPAYPVYGRPAPRPRPVYRPGLGPQPLRY
jgi:hypothetical protein